jgi:hypothetical protein
VQNPKPKKKEVAAMERRIAKIQRTLRKHVKPGRSMVDELIRERREEARIE